MVATIYTVDGEVKTVTPRNGTNFKLDELQEFVGGLVEIVPIEQSSKIMVVNEKGKLLGLPVNTRATDEWPTAYGPNDVIVGNALICEDEEVQ